MHYNVIATRYLHDYVVWLKFEDGTEGEVDLASELWGPMFEPLKHPERFGEVSLAEYGTIAWPNGADLAPEFLYERVRANVADIARGAASRVNCNADQCKSI
jgi:uncharacterized protein DUF2442